MRRVLFVLCALAGIGAAVFFVIQDRANWASVTEQQSFVFEDVILHDVATGDVADMDALATEPFLGGLFSRLNTVFRTETARGYGQFDPDTQVLALFVGGEVTEVTYDPNTPMTAVALPGAGPIEVHWDHGSLSAELVAPVTFGASPEWTYNMSLVAADDVTDRIAAQEKIIADAIAAKADWRALMIAMGDAFPETSTFAGPTQDNFLSGWQAVVTYPADAFLSAPMTALNAEVILPDQRIIELLGYPSGGATKAMTDFKATFEDIPEMDRVIIHETPTQFVSVVYGELPLLIAVVELAHVSYVVQLSTSEIAEFETALAVAQSIAPRVLAAPAFDANDMTRADALTALGYPPLEVGRSWDQNIVAYNTRDLAALFEPANLIARDNSRSIISEKLSAFPADTTDRDSMSVDHFEGHIHCLPFTEQPTALSDVHDAFVAHDRVDFGAFSIGSAVANFVESGAFAKGERFQDTYDHEQRRWTQEWFVDGPQMALGTEGPLYFAYRAEQVGWLTLVCVSHNANPLRAWLTLELYGDIDRPADVIVPAAVLDQFRAYSTARYFGPGFFLVGENLKPGQHLISGDGTVLIDDMLRFWDWDALTQTINAEDDNGMVGLYLPDGTPLLPHEYEDIDGWDALGPDVVQARKPGEDQFYDIRQRIFIDDPTQ